MLFPAAFSPSFFVLYALCGLTDWLDGALARRLGSTSPLGALLDSLGDAVFTAVTLSRVLPVLKLPVWALVCIVCIVLVRAASLAVGARRFGQSAFLHTYLNKLTGLVLFVLVPLLSILPQAPLLILCCAVAALSSIEELILICTMDRLDRDVRGLFFTPVN